MSKPEIPQNHWIPVGVGDQWSVRCLNTGEFLANGKTPNEPWLVPKVSIALTLCTNCESGNYDNAPPGDVWFVISDGNGKTRGDKQQDARRVAGRVAAFAAEYKVTVPEAWAAPAPVAQQVLDRCIECRRADSDGIPLVKGCALSCHFESINPPALAAPAQVAQPMTPEQIDALMPPADGTAEANVRRIEVLPGVMGTEFDEVDAWSRPLVHKVVRAALAKRQEGGAA